MNNSDINKKLPPFLKPFLLSYDFSNLDIEKDQKNINESPQPEGVGYQVPFSRLEIKQSFLR